MKPSALNVPLASSTAEIPCEPVASLVSTRCEPSVPERIVARTPLGVVPASAALILSAIEESESDDATVIATPFRSNCPLMLSAVLVLAYELPLRLSADASESTWS